MPVQWDVTECVAWKCKTWAVQHWKSNGMHDLDVRNLRATRSMISVNTHCVPICRKYPFGVPRQRTPTYVAITRRPWQSCTLRQPTDGTRSQLSAFTNLITASKSRAHRAELTEARQMAVPQSRRLLVPTKTDVAAGDNRKLSRTAYGRTRSIA